MSEIPADRDDPAKGYKDIKILILPTRHCMLNPIELVWGWIKGQVAKHNKQGKLEEVMNLTRAAIDNVGIPEVVV